MDYSFGVPGKVVWTVHIIVGLFLFWVGYRLLNNQPVDQKVALILVILGPIVAAYHSHLFYINTIRDT